MSMKVPKNCLSSNDIEIMERKLILSQEINDSNKGKQKHYQSYEKISFFRIDNSYLYVPFFWGRNHFANSNISSLNFENINIHFQGNLRPEQQIVCSHAIESLIKSNSVLISCYPGFGKTTITLDLITRMKKKTIVIVNKIALLEQWKEEINKYLGIEPVVIKGKNSKISNSFIYLVNCINIDKHDLSCLNIGTVIVDECHLIMTKVFSKSLLHLCPEYLIGLSATSYRYDNFDKLFDLYFGFQRIHRSLHKEHKVIQFLSKEKINHTLDKNGNINWSSVIDHQSKSVQRRETICKFALEQEGKDRNIMILCKRIEHMKALHARFIELGETSVEMFKENDTTFNKDARILITSYQKAGVGFSHNKMDTLILGTDTKDYFLQYLGRVFRTPQTTPIVFDIVDDHPLLARHFYERKKVYLECGGVIEKRVKN